MRYNLCVPVELDVEAVDLPDPGEHGTVQLSLRTRRPGSVDLQVFPR